MKKIMAGTMAAVSLLLIPADAGAHSYDVGASVSIHRTGGTFHGRVSSVRPACENNRKVTLFKVRRGEDRAVERTTTNKKGGWAIRRSGARGRFYVHVKARFRSRHSHNHVCRSATSRKIRG